MTAAERIKYYLKWHDENNGGDMALTHWFGISDLRELLDHNERMQSGLDATAKFMHPEYGPCDAIADGACAECRNVVERLHEAIRSIHIATIEGESGSELQALISHADIQTICEDVLPELITDTDE